LSAIPPTASRYSRDDHETRVGPKPAPAHGNADAGWQHAKQQARQPALQSTASCQAQSNETPNLSSNVSVLCYLLRAVTALLLFFALPGRAQVLLNVDFGVGSHSPKLGFAATGQSTNDFWNLYRHYDPKFVPGMQLVAEGELKNLRLADGIETKIVLAVTNAPGVWGNASGDPMFETYIFAQNGSNIVVTLRGLEPGRYHFYLYGHADPDVTGEQNSVFTLHSSTNRFGPLTTAASAGWKVTSPWQERYQHVVFRDVPVLANKPVIIEVAAGANGVAVLNGLQIISRGTSPPLLVTPLPVQPPSVFTNLLVHEIRYDGKVSDTEARFQVTVDIESLTTNEISRLLFEGDVGLIAPEIPAGLRIVSGAKQYRLFCSAAGSYRLNLELVTKITRAEPWNQISFYGPVAAIASMTAMADSPGIEMQLLSGTQVDLRAVSTSPPASPSASEAPSARLSRISGFLGTDRQLSMRWQSKSTEVARKSLVTVDTIAQAQIAPTVIRYNTQFRYDILQAPVAKLAIALPTSHTLTKVQGEQIRDWSVKPDGNRSLLTIEFVKPIEKSYALVLLTEQPVESTLALANLDVPTPLHVERESGSFSLSTEDMAVEVDSISGLRQVNAPSGALTAYRFYGRPFGLAARVKRIEPVLKAADRITARLEETRLLVHHSLALNIEKAGIYVLELTPATNFVVADVRGEGIDDWKFSDGKLRVSFARQILGAYRLDVQLEQAQKTFPDQVVVAPLRVSSATNETASVGLAATLGIQLKSSSQLTGLREIPVAALTSPSDEILAFAANEPEWRLALAAERLPARVTADVFNLITVGDGLVGGSAVIRYGIINQGVQEFRVMLPAHWKNIEFTGPNIRSKEQLGTNAMTGTVVDTNVIVWKIVLQDKAWGGYTLVVTYDYQFDPKQATLNLAGVHALGVERETGSIAVANAAALQLQARPVAEPLRLIDQSELAETDRALITRPVLLAYRYTGNRYQLLADAIRNQEAQGLLNAVADRTQLTSVITEEGQMLSQASFMVKNNDKQFQRFQLPRGATLWGCYVNNNPIKAEQDGDWLMVSLPRGANRDQAFAVDIVYKQTLESFKGGVVPRSIDLAAPRTDVPNTYAEWQLYVPTSQRLSSFGGSMSVQRGTTYDLRDAWRRFTEFYSEVLRDHGQAIIVWGGLAVFFLALIGAAMHKGSQGVLGVLAAFMILALMAGMLLPALSKAKAKAQRISAVNSLKQISVAASLFANEHGRLPASYEEMMEELRSDRILRDPQTGERFVYVGAGKRADDPRLIVAYSPVDINGRAVAFADGSVQQLSSAQFAEAMQRDAEAMRQPASLALDAAQLGAVRQLQEQPVLSATSVPGAAPGGRANRPPGSHRNNGGGESFGGIMAQAGLPMQGPASGVGGGIPAATAPARVVSGLRSIRIDIPRTGQAFAFTKVLNVSDEPLSIRMSVMKLKAFRVIRSTLQLGCFLAGLFLIWREWHRSPSRSLYLTIGLALVMGAVVSLGVAARALHSLLIIAVPLLLAALVFWLGWKLWPRRPLSPTPKKVALGNSQERSSPAASSVVAAIALLLSLSALAGSVRAEESSPEPSTQNSQPSTLSNSVSLVSATYTGAVREKVAQFDVALVVSTIATNQTVPLFGSDVAVESFSTEAKGAMLIRLGRGVALRLADKGNALIKLKLVVKLSGDVTKRQLAFNIPPALSSKLSLSLDEPEADVEFPSAVAFKRTTDKEQTRVEAILGAGDRVDLFWTPQMKRVGDMAASVFAQNTTLISVGGGAVNTRSVIDYQISQGELRQVKVRLPAEQRLLRVEGDWIRTWELSDQANAQLLTVDLLKGVSPGYRITIETERVLDKLSATVKAEVPQVQDVIRESGLVALRGSEELNLTIEQTRDLQRIDATEFAKGGAFKPDGILGAYRFAKQGFQLIARADAIQPEIQATVRNDVHIGFEQVTIASKVDYTIRKAGVFNLRLIVPAGCKIDSVTGADIVDWNDRTTTTNAVEIRLKQRTMGSYGVQLSLSKAHRDLPKTIEITGVRPLDVQKLAGFVSITSDAGVALKTTAFDGLTEIPAASIGEAKTGASVLAFKLVGTNPQQGDTWKLSLMTETVESWVRAEVVNLVSVSETLVSGRSIVRYEIQNAPVKEFRLKVPAALTNIEILGANVRQRDSSGEAWRVELQNKIRGSYTLTVTWEQQRPASPNSVTNGSGGLLSFAGIEALGVERETGVIVLLSKPALQLVEKTLSDQLIRIDLRDVPDWADLGPSSSVIGGEVPVLAFRYLRPGYALTFEARRFDEAAVLQALVDSARFTTVVADDGQMMTEMALSIRNNGLQNLEVELPPKAQVWSAFVASQPVRPTTRGNKLLLPLERSGSDEAPVSVELIYVTREPFPRTKGRVELISPRLDVPLKNARWDLYLPPDYDYSKFAGSMTHEAADAPTVQVYSSVEYRKQEEGKKVAQKSELLGFLSSARRSLAQGKFKAANEEFNNAARLSRAEADGDAVRELDDLKKELSKTQSSNLIQAQRDYTTENLKRLAGKDAAANAPADELERVGKLVQYDAETAERQWGALQRAQEVTIAKVQPLRANLPTRGVRLSFSQALQTEVNKPMTVAFAAANAKHVGWFQQMIYLIAGFWILWAFVSVANARRNSEAP
jgi:hypothetical protein